MDIEKYIASGILEAYALDDLPASERAAVEEMLVQYPELKAELNTIEEGLEMLALETAVAPPAFMKAQILAEADKASFVPESNPEKETKVVAMPSSAPRIWTYVAAASVVLMLVSSYLAFDYRTKWKGVQESYAQLAQTNELIADQYNQVNQRLDGLTQDIDVMSDLNFARVQMASTTDDESIAASVYWNEKTLEAYLNIGSLKALAQEQQYQLWAIVDGKPVDMGAFDPEGGSLLKMKPVSNAATFAVTIEPRGGSINPTLTAMQVAGNV